MVRETNRQVLGFYASLGYAYTPRAVMARWLQLPSPPPEGEDLPPDLAVAAGRDFRRHFTVTYLEMTERPASHRWSIRRTAPRWRSCGPNARRSASTAFLYNGVGEDWNWWYRREMSDEDLGRDPER